MLKLESPGRRPGAPSSSHGEKEPKSGNESGSGSGSESDDLDDPQNARQAVDASDFIAGEADFGEDEDEIIPRLRLAAHHFYRQRLIDLKRYVVQPKTTFRQDASDVLINLCKGKEVKACDVIDLIELGASTNYQKKGRYDTALHWVARRGHHNVLWIFLQRQLGTNVNLVDSRNSTALMLACDTYFSEQAPVVRDLLQVPGIKINVRDSGGNTALLNAIYKNNVWVVRELLLHGAALSVLDRQEVDDPAAYDIAQFIFASGLLMEAEEVAAINPLIIEPELATVKKGSIRSRCAAWWYHNLSFKGHYKYSLLLYLQTLWKYDAEMVFRMVQRKSYLEGRVPTRLKKGDAAQNAMHRKVSDRHKMIQDKYYAPSVIRKRKGVVRLTDEERARKKMERKIKMSVSRANDREKREIEKWNNKRKANAAKVDSDFDHRIRGGKSNQGISAVEMKSLAAQNDAKAKTQSKPHLGSYSSTSKGRRGHYGVADGADDEDDMDGMLPNAKGGRKGNKLGRKHYSKEDQEHLRSKEWFQHEEHGLRDWELGPKRTIASYTPVPDLPKTTVPKPITLSQMKKQQFNRTHLGHQIQFDGDDEDEEEAINATVVSSGMGSGSNTDIRKTTKLASDAWKNATATDKKKNAVRAKLLQDDPDFFIGTSPPGKSGHRRMGSIEEGKEAEDSDDGGLVGGDDLNVSPTTSSAGNPSPPSKAVAAAAAASASASAGAGAKKSATSAATKTGAAGAAVSGKANTRTIPVKTISATNVTPIKVTPAGDGSPPSKPQAAPVYVPPGSMSLTASLNVASTLQQMTAGARARAAKEMGSAALEAEANARKTTATKAQNKLIRTDIGFIDAKSAYAAHALDPKRLVTRKDLDRDDYEGDDYFEKDK